MPLQYWMIQGGNIRQRFYWYKRDARACQRRTMASREEVFLHKARHPCQLAHLVQPVVAHLRVLVNRAFHPRRLCRTGNDLILHIVNHVRIERILREVFCIETQAKR